MAKGGGGLRGERRVDVIRDRAVYTFINLGVLDLSLRAAKSCSKPRGSSASIIPALRSRWTCPEIASSHSKPTRAGRIFYSSTDDADNSCDVAMVTRRRPANTSFSNPSKDFFLREACVRRERMTLQPF